MARIYKSIAVILLSVLGGLLLAVSGLLSNLLASHPDLLNWLKAKPWYTPQNLTLALVVVVTATISLAILDKFFSRKKELATCEDVDSIVRKALGDRFDSAIKEGRIPEQELKTKDEEITRLTGELRKLQEQLATRSSEPEEAELSRLLQVGDLDAALRLKSQQVQVRRSESGKLPRDLYELGTIHELRFEWPQALDAYREAWELGAEPEHGFKYAYIEQKLNHFKQAIATYESLLAIQTDPEERATTLNNLAILYSAIQRMKQAEEAYDEALTIYRKLAEVNPDAYLPYVATTLNNLANLYSAIQRMKQAEGAYDEALSIRRKLAKANPDAYLPDVAMTLNNLAILYSNTQRMQQAEEAYDEALTIRRKLAEVNPDAYLPYVATTLNNLAILYCDTQCIKQAEETYDEALTIYRKLAKVNPDVYLPYVATTLNNIAVLYSATQRMQQAEEAYVEALKIYRKLAEVNPDAYLPDVAGTLNNLAGLFFSVGRIKEAETHAVEAGHILEPLWQANPELHGNQMARTLGRLALIAEASQQPAAEGCSLARRAMAAAYDPLLKQFIQQLIDRLCPASEA